MQNPSKQLTEWHKSSVSTKLSPDSPSPKENLAKTLDGNVPHPYSIQILKNQYALQLIIQNWIYGVSYFQLSRDNPVQRRGLAKSHGKRRKKKNKRKKGMNGKLLFISDDFRRREWKQGPRVFDLWHFPVVPLFKIDRGLGMRLPLSKPFISA